MTFSSAIFRLLIILTIFSILIADTIQPPPIPSTHFYGLPNASTLLSFPCIMYQSTPSLNSVANVFTLRVNPSRLLETYFTKASIIGAGGYNFIYPVKFLTYNTVNANTSLSIRSLIIKLPRKDNYLQVGQNRNFRKSVTKTTLPYQLLAKEAEIMIQLGYHPHIVQLHSMIPLTMVRDTSVPMIQGLLYEECLMNLAEYCLRSSSHSITVHTRLMMVKGITEALHYSHLHGILHGDIKLENILLCHPSPLSSSSSIASLFPIRVNDTDVIVKLADYLSLPTESTRTLHYYSAGYRAPELVESMYENIFRRKKNGTVSVGKDFSTASAATDVFALSMVIRKLFQHNWYDTGIYLNDTEIDLDTAMYQGYRPSLDPFSLITNTPSSLLSLIARMWSTNPSERPSTQDVLFVIDNLLSTNTWAN